MTAPFWAGLHGSGLANWPSIVVPGKEVPQQCAGAKSNTPSTAGPGKGFPGQLHSTRDEQHRGGGSCKTEGQCSVAQPLQSGEGPEQLVQVSGHQGTSPAHLRARKQQVLSRIPHISRLEELEALPKVSQGINLFGAFSAQTCSQTFRISRFTTTTAGSQTRAPQQWTLSTRTGPGLYALPASNLMSRCIYKMITTKVAPSSSSSLVIATLVCLKFLYSEK